MNISTTNEKETPINVGSTAAAPTLKATAKEFVPGGGFKPPATAAAPIQQPLQQVPVSYPYPYMPAQVSELTFICC